MWFRIEQLSSERDALVRGTFATWFSSQCFIANQSVPSAGE